MKADTYFFSPQEALRVASQQNRSNDVNQYHLQLCYYNGDKIESDLVNLIHLPIDNLVDDLAIGRFRIPLAIDFTGLDISLEVAKEIEENLLMSFSKASLYRKELNKVYVERLQNTKLDFSEPLRIYLLANSGTRVMQYVSKDIAKALESRGYNVFFDLLYGIEDAECKKNIFEFNPHITINVNHFVNLALGEDVFNFIWFQDFMPALTNPEAFKVRDRDYVFIYHSMFKKPLIDKGVSSDKIFDFKIIPVDQNIFYLEDSIKREDKVAFVGTRYGNLYSNYIDEGANQKIHQLIKDGKSLSIENLETIFSKGLKLLPDADKFINHLQQRYIRNSCVSWLCQSSKEVEVYGYNWEKSGDENIISNFKGEIDKVELNKLYNSAKYVLSASASVINTQRLGETIYAGAIPLIYDSRDITDEEETWDDECLYFKTKEELMYILDNDIVPKNYRPKEMLDYFTYDSFIDTMFEQIDNTLKGQK